MWTRAELKMRAKERLRRYYWTAFVVSLIVGLLSGSGGGRSGFSFNVDRNLIKIPTEDVYYERNGALFEDTIFEELFEEIFDDTPLEDLDVRIRDIPGGTGAFLRIGNAARVSLQILIMISALIGILFGIFVTSVLEVGKLRFYMESQMTGQDAGISRILWGFKHHYGNIVWTMFLKNVIIFAGTICCVIPGIYFTYCYTMVPYILAENPDMKAGDALRLSKDMMQGHKFNTWILELSFIGWWLLGALACGVGVLFVQPYFDATMAELYGVLRQPFSHGLRGFGYNDYNHGYYGNGYYDS